MSEQIALLAFAVAIIGLEVLVMIVRGSGWGPMSTRMVGFSLVVLVGLILAMSPVAGDARSAAFGILGVVAGYLASRPAQEKTDT
jgi:uncharacterized membrane protein YidH (DUF202 family)